MYKKLICVILSLSMILSVVPAFADNNENLNLPQLNIEDCITVAKEIDEIPAWNLPEYNVVEGNFEITDLVADSDYKIIENNNLPSVYSSGTAPSDSSYRLLNINGKDNFALQNQTGKTNYIGDDIGSEYIDSMTGNLTVTETDLCLPGRDGFDLNLSRYYSLSQAELYTKQAGVNTNAKSHTLLQNAYVVEETIKDTFSGEAYTYNYPYYEYNKALKRKSEIESRDTDKGRFNYSASIKAYNKDDEITFDYYYTSEIISSSYTTQRYNLGAGWSWSFPSVQTIKENYSDETEVPSAIYYHDGKGNVIEVEYNPSSGECELKNYVGMDVSFDYCPGYTGATSRIDYMVEDADLTTYYFGIYGELRRMQDAYGNIIDFYYQYKDFYGAEDMPVISQITDSVGRIIDFSYTTDGAKEKINISVTSPLEPENELSLCYEKEMVVITNINDEFVSREPVLTRFTNALGEITSYQAAEIDGERALQPVKFTFADKIFDSEYVYNTGGYMYNYVYLLGNIVRPSSNTAYSYELCERNLGHSGVSEAYRIKARGDYLLAAKDSELPEEGGKFALNPLLLYQCNTADYEYDMDYTGYPEYNSIDSMPEDIPVTVKEYSKQNEYTRIYKKYGGVLLLEKTITEYYNPVGNSLTVTGKVLEYIDRQPQITKISYSNGMHSYDSYVRYDISTYMNKSYGKPELVTEEIDYSLVYSVNREKYATAYTYNPQTAFVTSKSWYKDEDTQCTEYYSYDSNNRLLRTIAADGAITNYSYEYSGGKVSKKTTTVNNGNETIVIVETYTADTDYTYPSTVTKTVNGITETTSYTYNMLLGTVETVTDTEGNITTYEYDKLGRTTKIIYPRYTTYNEPGTKNIIIQPIETIAYEYVIRDYEGEVNEEHFIIVQLITENLLYYDISSGGEISSDTLLTREKPEYSFYLGTGEIIESIIPDILAASDDSNTTHITHTYYYDFYNNTVTLKDSKGNTTTIQYDGLGREAKLTDEFDNYHITEYNIDSNGAGFKAQAFFVPADNRSAKENIVEYTYDRWQRVTSEKGYSSEAEYSEIKYSYDIAGNVISVTDANGNITTNSYDKLNRIVSSVNPNNEILRYYYDNLGNVKKQTLNGEKLFERSYDGEGKLLTDTDNSGNSNVYTYNAKGQLTGRQDKDNKLYTAQYNSLGSVELESIMKSGYGITERHYGNFASYGLQSVFNIKGVYKESTDSYSAHLTEISREFYSPSGKLLIQRSEYGQDTGISGVGFNPYIENLYDTEGNVTCVIAGCINNDNSVNGFATHYEYDKNRISKVQLNGSGTKNTDDSVNASYEFYPDGKLKAITYPNGILKSEYAYDGLSRLISLVNYKGTEILSSYSYAYDKNGNILTVNATVEDETDAVNYTYDKLNRISTVSGTKGADSYYEYDERGNRKVNYEQIDFLSEESAEFEYDELDRLTSALVGADFTSFDYSVDGLRYVKQTNNDMPEFYIYDDLGRLLAKCAAVYATINGTQQIIMHPIKQYIWGPDRALAQIDILTGNTYYYLYNGHGDVIQITDINGNVVNSYDYDVWGNFLKKEETIENHFTYFGQTYDETTGLYYLRARYYNPTIGRFTQQDTAEDGYNWYIYGNQNPVIFVDYDGLDGQTVDLGKGWYYRIDKANPNTKTQRHIHIYNREGKNYSQNVDGSPHDKNNNSDGKPPNSILKKIKEKENWDYTKKDNSFFDNVQVVHCDSGVVKFIYPDKYSVVKVFDSYYYSITEEMLRNIYYGTSAAAGAKTYNNTYVIPMINPSIIPVSSYFPLLIPAF